MSEFYAAIVLAVCAVFVAATITVGKSIKLSEASTGNVFGFADAPAAVIDRQEFTVNGDEFPITYELEYDPNDIVDTYLYAVDARVDLGADLLAINDTVFPAITNGAGTDVDVSLIVVES